MSTTYDPLSPVSTPSIDTVAVQDDVSLAQDGPNDQRIESPETDLKHQGAGANPLCRIVVGVDGSDSSVSALRRGSRIATALGAHLEAIATWRNPTGYAGLSESYTPERDAQEILKDAETLVFGFSPPPWFSARTAEGNADQVLIDDSRGAEILILGSRGHGGIAGVLLGSVSGACAEHASCPVLIMH